MQRPRPPAALLEQNGALGFVPAPDLLEWATSTFIAQGAPLENPEHAHLQFATIGVLWTNTPNSRHGRGIVGQAEFKPPNIIGRWAKARAQAQLAGWFGAGDLDFLLTFDALYADRCSDAEFCALVEHELCHCGQAKDEFGAPKFSTQTGVPIFAMRGHDIEQFTSVVARYGADAAGVRALIDAAERGPSLDTAAISACCGTCAG
jgi:hypothetical protein